MVRERERTILAVGSLPGAGVIALGLESNSEALFHIASSVTSGIQAIPESSAETDSETGLLQPSLDPFSGLSGSKVDDSPICDSALLGSFAFSKVDTTSRRCSAVIFAQD